MNERIDVSSSRRECLVVAGALLSLTVLALIPCEPRAPLDGVTWRPAEGFETSFSIVGAALEPFLALGHVVVGAPDFRAAVKSIVAWTVLLGFAVGLVYRLRSGWSPSAARAVGFAAVVAAGCLLALIVNTGFVLFTPVPTYRLDARDPDVVLVDLQSHTVWSHDGLATVRHNLETHRAWGFDAVAVTEHNNMRGAANARKLADRLADAPAVIPGMEVRRVGFLMTLGDDLAEWTPPETPEAAVAAAHARGLAVVCLPWRMDVEETRRVAAAGVDGFEIINGGHPDLPEDVRQAILQEAAARGFALVASTDWHGWSSFCRTWTAVRIPGWRAMTREALATRIVEKIKRREARDFTPVSLGRMGVPSVARAIFAPLVEISRYCMELDFARVVAWWVWVLALAFVVRRLRAAGFAAFPVVAGVLTIAMSSVLLVQAVRFVATSNLMGATTELASDLGFPVAMVAMVAIVAGAALLWHGISRSVVSR